MIILDIETSGIHQEKHGICEIAAMDSDNPSNYFHDECRIDDDEDVMLASLDVVGITEEEVRDKKKQSQKEMLEHFFAWCKTPKMKNCLCQGPIFDLGFITQKARKHGLQYPLHYRSFDLHTITAYRYLKIRGKFFLDGDHSGMDLTKTLEFCGLEDNRISVDINTRKVIREGVPHNALSDIRLTAECFSRLVYGKNLLPEFASKIIPDYLKN